MTRTAGVAAANGHETVLERVFTRSSAAADCCRRSRANIFAANTDLRTDRKITVRQRSRGRRARALQNVVRESRRAGRPTTTVEYEVKTNGKRFEAARRLAEKRDSIERARTCRDVDDRSETAVSVASVASAAYNGGRHVRCAAQTAVE